MSPYSLQTSTDATAEDKDAAVCMGVHSRFFHAMCFGNMRGNKMFVSHSLFGLEQKQQNIDSAPFDIDY
jgi:hypothetical protein